MYGDFAHSDVRVAVVSVDPLVRSALSGGLRAYGELRVVGDVELADVVVWDTGADASTALHGVGELARLRVPALALIADPELAVQALAAGARAVMMRESPHAALVAALIAVHRGLYVLDPPARAALSRDLRLTGDSGDSVRHAFDDLTAREIEVLAQLAAGLSNKRIARRLGISEHTAKFHVNSILTKLGARSRTAAVVAAARRGLVAL